MLFPYRWMGYYATTSSDLVKTCACCTLLLDIYIERAVEGFPRFYLQL